MSKTKMKKKKIDSNNNNTKYTCDFIMPINYKS